MREGEHDAEFVGVWIDFEVFRDADEASIIEGGVGDRLCDDVEVIEFGAGARGDDGEVFTVGGGEGFGGGGGVGGWCCVPLGVGLEEFATLGECVGVACHFADIGEF